MDKILHPWVQKFYPALGLSSELRLLSGLQAPFLFGDRDRGVKSPKINEGGENFEFFGAPEIDPFLQRFYRNLQFGGQKSKFSRGNFRGEFPPPLVFGTF